MGLLPVYRGVPQGWGLLGSLYIKKGVGLFLGPNFGQWAYAN